MDHDGLFFKKLGKIFKWVAAIIAVAAFVALMPGAGGALAGKFLALLKAGVQKGLAKIGLKVGGKAAAAAGKKATAIKVGGQTVSTKKAAFAVIHSGAKAASAMSSAVGETRLSGILGLVSGGFGMAALGDAAKVGDWVSFGINSASNTAYATGYKEIGAITGMMAGLFDATATAFNRWGPKGIKGELFAYPMDGMYELGAAIAPAPDNWYAQLKITASGSKTVSSVDKYLEASQKNSKGGK